MIDNKEKSAVSSDERLRNFEILRYGRSVHFQKIHTASNQSETVIPPIDWSTPKLSFSATLTALCQLVALRMTAKRAFISLVDGTDQHILAEATRSVSLYDAAIHDVNDNLIFGTQSIDSKYGLTQVTFPAFLAGGEKHWFQSDVSISDASKYVISNVNDEPRVQHVPFVKERRIDTFYVEVPLRSSKGRTVGTVGVFDDEPRSNPAAVDVLPMHDVAKVIIEHLELVGLRDVTSRAERLMQGLAAFNRKPSLVHHLPPEDTELHAKIEDRTPYETLVSTESALTDDCSKERVDRNSSRETEDVDTGYTSKFVVKSDPVVLLAPDDESAFPKTPASAPQTVVGSTSADSFLSQASPDSSRPAKHDSDAFAASFKDTKQFSTTKVFAKASDLIRYAMDLEAVCFIEPASKEPIYRRYAEQSLDPSSDSQGLSESQGALITHVSDSDRGTATSQDEKSATQDSKKVLCTHLAFSSRQATDSINAQQTRGTFTLSNTSLQRLAGLYPDGYIFHFDAFGVLSSEDELKFNSNTKRLSQRREAARAIRKAFPEARSLLFMPLYNTDQQYLHAALCGWTTNDARMLSQSDSIYVSGFAHSIMCEVSRLEALALTRAKSDFMSSMSHELRSPLHGIIAATYLFQGTEMSVEQIELASMVDDCGRTLLDVVNNVLEHAKMNQSELSVSQVKKPRKRKDQASAEHGQHQIAQTASGTVNLAKLLEETVISVAAGHLLKEQRSVQFDAKRLTVTGGSETDSSNDRPHTKLRPPVVLNVQYRDEWNYAIDAGAWRRIVMNLVGNSLKYTANGHISVSLRAQNIFQPRSGNSNAEVVLKVTDTGQGISKNYMKHRLYTPFSQEDNLSVGAGLGLSITSRLVASMNGSIQLDSEVNKGSTFVVKLPVGSQLGDGLLSKSAADTLQSKSERITLSEQTICLIGFSSRMTEDMTPDHKRSSETRALEALKRSLEEILREWGGVSITSEIDKATIVVVEESTASAMLQNDPGNVMFLKKYIVADTYAQTSIRKNKWKGICRVVSAPIGPFKLMQALSALLSESAYQASPLSSTIDVEVSSQAQSLQTTDQTHDVPTTEGASERLLSSKRVPRSPATMSESLTPSKTARLLLVDDNDINLRLLGNFVKNLKLEHEVAHDGQEAVDHYIIARKNKTPFSVIFMDISMPVMDGITATKQIRLFEKANNVELPAEIIALTGLGHEDTRRDAMASGVDQYLRKPVKFGLLKDILKGIL